MPKRRKPAEPPEAQIDAVMRRTELETLRDDIADGPDGEPTMTFEEAVMMAVNDHGRRVVSLEETLNLVMPIISDGVTRLDAVEALVEKLGPAIQKVIGQQREMIAELKAELALKDAELARLRGDVTMN